MIQPTEKSYWRNIAKRDIARLSAGAHFLCLFTISDGGGTNEETSMVTRQKDLFKPFYRTLAEALRP